MNEKENFLHVYFSEMKKGSDGAAQFSDEVKPFLGL